MQEIAEFPSSVAVAPPGLLTTVTGWAAEPRGAALGAGRTVAALSGRVSGVLYGS